MCTGVTPVGTYDCTRHKEAETRDWGEVAQVIHMHENDPLSSQIIEISTFFMLYDEDDQSKLKSVLMTEVAKWLSVPGKISIQRPDEY